MEHVNCGDIIEFVEHPDGYCGEPKCKGASSWGRAHVGKRATITHKYPRNNYILISEDGNCYRYSPCMFVRISGPPAFTLEGSGKIKKFDYRGLVDRIGVEFEGYYNRGASEFEEYVSKGLWNGHDDGSLDYGDIDSDEFYEMEYVTRPFREDELGVFLGAIDRHFKDGSYKINESCGLHFHISLKNTVVYSSICNADFFYKVVNMFKEKHPRVYGDRQHNHYSESTWEGRYHDEQNFLRGHFRKESDDRYHAVNFAYDKHGTVEVRFYGGEYATIEGLAQSIQAVIDIIAQKAKERQHVKREFESPQTEERYNQPLDIMIPNKNTYHRLRALKIHRAQVHNFDIVMERGGEMYIDMNNSRFYETKKRLAQNVTNKYGYAWDIIFALYRSTPLDAFASMVKKNGKTETEEYILGHIIEEVGRIARGNPRRAVEDHFYRRGGDVQISNDTNYIKIKIIR